MTSLKTAAKETSVNGVSKWTLCLSPIQILLTDLHTFPSRISWETLIKDQSVFSQVVHISSFS